MKKEIRVADEKRGIMQLTTVDERFYIKPGQDEKTGLPVYKFVPSVTWICESYPKGIGFYKWLSERSWDESEALKAAAGEKGSKIHQACSKLIDGKEVRIDSKFIRDDGVEEELSVEEYEAVLSFAGWCNKMKPKFLGSEFVVWNDRENYAGTVDIYCMIGDVVYIVDIKTGQNIWPSYELQLSAYKAAMPELEKVEKVKLAILQVGYRRNKDGFKFTEIEDKYPLFLAAKQIWANDHGEEKPKQKDLPLMVKL